MKKFTVIIFLLQISVVFSQSSWIRQDSLPGYTTIYGIGFPNENTGIISANKYLIKTINGGLNWNILNYADSNNFQFTQAISNNEIFVSDFHGYIFKTSNAGINWTRLFVTSDNITAMFFFNYNTGYIASNSTSPSRQKILKTTNGGSTWDSLYGNQNVRTYSGIFGFNPDTVFVVTGYGLLKTVNGGINWSYERISAAGYNQYSNKIIFVNRSTGFICGVFYYTGNTTARPMILKTVNGGINWSAKYFQYPINTELKDISFIDVNNGVAVGDSGTVFRTTNSGNTWTRQSKLSKNLYTVCFRGPNKITAGGLRGTIFSSTNGGWDILSPPQQFFPADNSQYINLNPLFDWNEPFSNAAFFRIQVSTDSVFTSPIIDVNNIDSSAYQLTSPALMPNTTYYWRVNSGNPVYTSSWSPVFKFNTNTPLPPVLLLPVNNDTSVVPAPLIKWQESYSSTSYKSQISLDSTFNQLIIDTNLSLLQFNIANNKLLWKTYYYWRVRGINSSGAGSWSQIWKFRTTNSRPTLIVPLNNSTEILYNTVFDWDNFPGATSYRIQFSSDSLFNNITYDNNYLSISQYILKLNLLQNTFYYWRVNASTVSYISFWSETRKFKTSPLYSGIIKEDNIPDKYQVSNYPNPFNSATLIKFDIPKKGKVRIVVYNYLGKVIYTVVDNFFDAGSYRINFDASPFPSGVYFCKFTAGDFTETKKMLLIK